MECKLSFSISKIERMYNKKAFQSNINRLVANSPHCIENKFEHGWGVSKWSGSHGLPV